MDILSCCNAGYKNETENLYEIPTFHMYSVNKNSSNYRRYHHFPLILTKKEIKENSLINNLQTESMESSYNQKNLVFSKDYMLQIKKINPIKLPEESEIGTNEDEDSSTDRKKYHDKKYVNNQRTNSETKDFDIDVMNLKNMLSESFKQKELFISNDQFKDELFSGNDNNKKIYQTKVKNMNRKKSANIIQIHQNYKYNYYKKINIKGIPNKKTTNKITISSKNLKVELFKKNKGISKDKNHYKKISIQKTLTKNIIKTHKNDTEKNEKNTTKKFPSKNKKIVNYNENKIFNSSNENKNLKASCCINNIKNCLSKSIIKYPDRDNSTNSKIRMHNRKLKISINNSNSRNGQIFLTNQKIKKQLSPSNEYIKTYKALKYNNIIKIKNKEQNLKKFNKRNPLIEMSNHISKIRKIKGSTGIENPFNEDNRSTNFTQKIMCNDSINKIILPNKINKFTNQRQKTKEKKN